MAAPSPAVAAEIESLDRILTRLALTKEEQLEQVRRRIECSFFCFAPAEETQRQNSQKKPRLFFLFLSLPPLQPLQKKIKTGPLQARPARRRQALHALAPRAAKVPGDPQTRQRPREGEGERGFAAARRRGADPLERQ